MALFFGVMFLGRVAGILGLAVLGRLLTPVDFGIIAYAAFATDFLIALQGRSFELSLIRIQKVEQPHIDTVFTLSLIWGAATAAMLLLASSPAARLAGEPALEPVLMVLSLVPLLTGLRSPRIAFLEKSLRFGPPAAQEMVVQVTRAAVAVMLALVISDYRAVVVGMIAGAAAGAGYSHLAAPGRLRLGLARLDQCLGFSGWVIAGNALLFLNGRIDRLFVGSYLGTDVLGVFRVGSEVARAMTAQIYRPLARVAFPGLSARAGSDSSLRASYLKLQVVSLGLMLPIGVGGAVVAPELCRVILGPQWLGAVPVIQVLAPILALGAVVQSVRTLVLVKGLPRILFVRDLLMLIISVPALYFGVAYFGFAGLLVSTALLRLVYLVVTLGVTFGLVGTGAGTIVRRSGRTIAASAAMALGAVLLGETLPAVDAATPFSVAALVLALKVGAGIAVFAATHLALWRMAGRPDGFETFALETMRGAWRRRA